jgi:hypothetical protein
MCKRILAFIGLLAVMSVLFIYTWNIYDAILVEWYRIVTGAFHLSVAKLWANAHALYPVFKTFIAKQLYRVVTVEAWKRPLISLGIPILIGAAGRRQIRNLTGKVQGLLSQLTSWFGQLPRWLQALIFVGTVGIIIVASLYVWWVGFAIFFVSLPSWMLVGLQMLLMSVWKMLQRVLFLSVFFGTLNKVWNFFVSRFPADWHAKMQAFRYRSVRIAIRRRRLTLKELRNHKITLRLRLSIHWIRFSSVVLRKKYSSKEVE